MEIKIYTLAHPLTGEIKYIGKTKLTLEKRLSGHINVGSLSKLSHKINWIKLLRSNNLIPIIELLDIVNEDNWRFWEMHYISLFKSWGFKLTNGTLGGDGVILIGEAKEKYKRRNHSKAMEKFRGENNVSKRPEVKEKISKALKGRFIDEVWRENISKAKKGKQVKHSNKGKKFKPRTKRNSNFGKPKGPQKKNKCIHCGIWASATNLKRWHLEKCRFNPLNFI